MFFFIVHVRFCNSRLPCRGEKKNVCFCQRTHLLYMLSCCSAGVTQGIALVCYFSCHSVYSVMDVNQRAFKSLNLWIAFVCRLQILYIFFLLTRRTETMLWIRSGIFRCVSVTDRNINCRLNKRNRQNVVRVSLLTSIAGDFGNVLSELLPEWLPYCARMPQHYANLIHHTTETFRLYISLLDGEHDRGWTTTAYLLLRMK